jgi:MFS family permease
VFLTLLRRIEASAVDEAVRATPAIIYGRLEEMPPPVSASHGRAAFTHPDFVYYEVARFFIVIALEMQSVAVGWQIFSITHRALDLGLVGLAQFLPGFCLFLASGAAADRFDRRKLLSICYAGFALCSFLLLILAVRPTHTVRPIYGVLVLLGVVRSLSGPVSRALLPHTVPLEHFPNAVALHSTIYQGATILGPAVGGVMYAAFHHADAVYAASFTAGLLALGLTLRLRFRESKRERASTDLRSTLAGFRYVWKQKLLLALISLDMFAVLLGGAVALLPVYASDILKTGPWGLGILRSAPGVGAALMAVYVAHRPIRTRAGITMMWAVAGFGIFTILFGISTHLAFSLVCLVLLGASDMISVIIRGTLIQLATPDEMRGRVNAVDMLFIGVSNELGQFESGVTAHWFGTVSSVVYGGIGTLVVIGLWAWIFPSLRKADRLSSVAASSLDHALDPGALGT